MCRDPYGLQLSLRCQSILHVFSLAMITINAPPPQKKKNGSNSFVKIFLIYFSRSPSSRFFTTLYPKPIVLSSGTSFILPVTFRPLEKVEKLFSFHTKISTGTLIKFYYLSQDSSHLRFNFPLNFWWPLSTFVRSKNMFATT